MSDSVSIGAFVGVVAAMVVAWAVSLVFTFRTAALRGHALATDGRPASDATGIPCSGSRAPGATAVKPYGAAERDQDGALAAASASDFEPTPPPTKPRKRPGIPRLDTGGGGASAASTAARPGRAAPGKPASLDGTGSLSQPGSAKTTSRRGITSSRRGSAAAPDTSHADDGDAILARARKQQAQGPKSAQEEMDASLSTVTNLSWSDVVLYRECGNGAFGTVYRGEVIGLDVAVKVANEDVIDDEGFLERFNRECGILAQLHHPNVLSLLAIVLDHRQRKYAIVTPFCPNGDLMSFITAPPDVLRSLDVTYGVRLMLRFAIDIARGCRFLHLRARVIQRDLKLANVLVDRFCNALLADFGLSRILRSDGGGAKPLTPCGSPAWTAPEIVEMRPYTRKVDVFSYGIMLWQLVAREEPYKDRENNIELAIEVATEGLRPKIPMFTPLDYADLMQRCWAANPDDRPEFDEIQERLNKMRRVHGGEKHRIALVPDIDVLRDAHQQDIDKAMRESGRSRSARSDAGASAAAAVAGSAQAAAAAITAAEASASAVTSAEEA